MAEQFTLRCKNGHVVKGDESFAKATHATVCLICYKPLLVDSVILHRSKEGRVWDSDHAESFAAAPPIEGVLAAERQRRGLPPTEGA